MNWFYALVIKTKVKENYIENFDKIKEYQKEYALKNKDKIREQRRLYNKKNIDKINEYHRKYKVKKRKENILSRLKHNYRNRTYNAFSNQGYNKNTKTMKMLGLDWNELKIHIENKFTNGMSWDNYGEWHIDHITPLSSARSKLELERLCKYDNLQPLWAYDNLSKGGVKN